MVSQVRAMSSATLAPRRGIGAGQGGDIDVRDRRHGVLAPYAPAPPVHLRFPRVTPEK